MKMSARIAAQSGPCATCGRYVEAGDVCSNCIWRGRTLKRVISYLHPHRAALLATLTTSVVMVLANLLTPIVTRAIVDDVLVPGSASSITAQTRDEQLDLL